MATWIVILALLFSSACLFVAIRQKLHVDAYKEELSQVLQEASAVKDELELIMNSTVELSRNVANDIDCRLQEYRETIDVQVSYSPPRLMHAGAASHMNPEAEGDHHKESPPANPAETPLRRRVYEIAREMNLESRELLALCREQGLEIKSHFSLVDPEVIYRTTGREQPAMLSEIVPAASLTQDIYPAPPLLGDSVQASDNEHRPDQAAILSSAEASFATDQEQSGPGSFTIDELRSAHPYIAVRTLHEQGYAVWEIAKLLGRGQGEINLILNLSVKKQARSL